MDRFYGKVNLARNSLNGWIDLVGAPHEFCTPKCSRDSSPDFSPQHRIRPLLVVRMLSVINKLYKKREAAL